MVADAELRLRRLLAELEITRKIKLYCRAVDRRDEALLRSLYHDDAWEEHGIYSGSAKGFCDWVMSFLHMSECSTHLVTNILVDVDDDRAVAESYFLTYSIGIDAPAGDKIDMVIGGRYLDRFELRDGDWRIAHRQVVIDWNNKASSDTVWDDDLRKQWTRGLPGADDLLYTLIGRGA